ncbi:hypothetical protein RJT34_21977 [Clitoria ternatea]|uniref:Polygalacturonase n=1 Tax=Clitoria ternatea TaxID=43366 RepID=A0AAN9IUT1_CLITE
MAIAKCAAAIHILILCFALAYNHAHADPIAKPYNVDQDVLLPGEKVINVNDLGAKPDGMTDCTLAFMDAWRMVCHNLTVPSRILIPPGRYFISSIIFQGPCSPPTPVTIQVQGTLLATTDISEFENGEWLMFDKINGLKIIGGGTFDGQGRQSWQYTQNCDANPDGPACQRNPSSLYFNEVSNVVVENIRSVNPKGFHIFVTKSLNVTLSKLKILAPETSPNTNGIHISLSDRVIISRNIIATGDDCISMAQGAQNIFIDKLKCGPGHGISIGSLGLYQNEEEVRGVRIQNCTLSSTTSGLRIDSWPDRYPCAASNISFRDIMMHDVKNPIIIDQEYECYPNCQKKPSLVKIENVHFANVRGTTVSPVAVELRCSKLNPCKGVTFSDIDLKFGAGPTTARCQNTIPLYNGFVMPPACV